MDHSELRPSSSSAWTIAKARPLPPHRRGLLHQVDQVLDNPERDGVMGIPRTTTVTPANIRAQRGCRIAIIMILPSARIHLLDDYGSIP